jgi:murein tripeptide amidase MpaA
MRTLIFCLVILLATSSVSFAAQLTTVAEQSGWKKTGRYDEVIKLCHEFATAYPKQAQCQSFGVTPEGRPMMVLVATSENKKIKKPTIMFQGGIHAGEIDGKDAGFLILREILSGKILTGLLEKTMLVFVPVFNVDGHERFGAHNRPNQIGPEEMGWRTTAQNYNLNRDYSKADSPEMAAMLMLLAKWDPILYVDLHVTDGAQFQHDVSLIVDPSLEGPKELKAAGIKLRDAAMQKLRATGHLPLDFYPEFDKED